MGSSTGFRASNSAYTSDITLAPVETGAASSTPLIGSGINSKESTKVGFTVISTVRAGAVALSVGGMSSHSTPHGPVVAGSMEPHKVSPTGITTMVISALTMAVVS